MRYWGGATLGRDIGETDGDMDKLMFGLLVWMQIESSSEREQGDGDGDDGCKRHAMRAEGATPAVVDIE